MGDRILRKTRWASVAEIGGLISTPTHRLIWYVTHGKYPSKIKQDLTNGPLGKVQELWDTQV